LAKKEIAFCKQAVPTASQLCEPNIYCSFEHVCDDTIFVLGNATIFEMDQEEIRNKCTRRLLFP